MTGASIFGTRTAPHVVLSWGGHPGYIPPPRFSPSQTTFCTGTPERGPNFDAARHEVHGWTSRPPPSLMTALQNAGRPTAPDLIVVATDVMKSNKIHGLDEFACPKLLLVGDTHHGPRPLEAIIAYARSEKFDALAILYDRHHAHWFRAAGFDRIAWAPGLTAQHCHPSGPSMRPNIISMVGQTGPIFPRRTRLLDSIRAATHSAFRFEVPRQAIERVLLASPITFNCSLNGDLNLRNFEAAAAGSMLITDRLCDASGFDLLFDAGKECVLYENDAELVDLCRHYLGRPQEAETIAGRARKRMASTPGYDNQAEKLAAWALGDGQAPFDIGGDPRDAASAAQAGAMAERLAIYQAAQLMHAERERIRAFVGRGCPAITALDLTDLPRLELAVDESRRDVRALLDEHGYAGRYETAAAPAACDLRLHDDGARFPQPTRASGTLSLGRSVAQHIVQLNAESAAIYRDRRAPDSDPGPRHSITSIGGPHGQLNLVTRRSPETAAALKKIFEDHRYAPYPALPRARLIVDIGAGEGLVAAQFRLTCPDAAILCFEGAAGLRQLLRCNATAIGRCEVWDADLPGDGPARAALADAVVAAMRKHGIDGPDILRLDAAGHAVAILEALALVQPLTRSFFVAVANRPEENAVHRQMATTHRLWQSEPGADPDGLLRFIRNDLAGPSKPA